MPVAEPDRAPAPRRAFLGVRFDVLPFDEVVGLIERADHGARFRYVVTPNADHVVRLPTQPELATAYDAAWLTLCDSRPLRIMARAMSLRLPLVTGSDLTAVLFGRVIPRGARVAVVAPTRGVLDELAARYPAFDIVGHVPPADIDNDPQALQRCVRFVVEADADYVFLAVGCPRSERIAHLASLDPRARGTCFCIGAALEFITGRKQRAPVWMRRLCLEWLHRLASDPVRLWRRYLFAVPHLTLLFAGEAKRRREARRSGAGLTGGDVEG